MRWVIYARYSDDLQNPKSIDDQISEARALIARRGGNEVGVYTDAAKSGAHVAGRPEYQRMFRAMRDDVFDAIISEDMDRLTRSLKEAAGLWDEAEHCGIELWTSAGGRIRTLFEAAFKGITSQDFLRNLAVKTRRGLAGVVKRGGIPGGRCYGYDVSTKAKRTINPAEAAIVRRICSEYASGKSPRRIVADLNREGVKGPRGGLWRVSTIIGNPKRLNGTLNNPIYAGVLVFNRQTFRKDPRTGRRIARENPKEKWLQEKHPELVIVDQATWDAVQRRREAAPRFGRLNDHHRPKTLLSGLIKCRLCGGPMTKMGDYFRCAERANSGACSNNKGIAVAKVEEITIDAVRAALTDPVLLARFAKVFRAHVDRRLAEENAASSDAGRRIADIDRKIANLMHSFETGLDSPTVRQRLQDLEAERRGLAAVTQRASAKVRALITENHILAERAAANQNLGARLQGDTVTATTMREAFRKTIAGIRSGPAEDGRMAVEVDGNIKGLLLLAEGPDDLRSRWLRELAPDDAATSQALVIPLVRWAA